MIKIDGERERAAGKYCLNLNSLTIVCSSVLSLSYWFSTEETVEQEGERKRAAVLLGFYLFVNLLKLFTGACCGTAAGTGRACPACVGGWIGDPPSSDRLQLQQGCSGPPPQSYAAPPSEGAPFSRGSSPALSFRGRSS